MTVLCTFPGKHGDLLWALPTVRAISELYAVPIDLQIGWRVGSLAELIQRQPYIGHVDVDAQWVTQDTAPPSPYRPPMTPPGYDRVFHLGYDAWPSPDLPHDIYRRFLEQLGDSYSIDVLDPPILDLITPWIKSPYALPQTDVCLGFTDEYFELKYGLYMLLHQQLKHYVNLSTSPRWKDEGGQSGYTWLSAAAWLGTTKVFLGCCSALHVLACAMGVPVVIMEPSEPRWNEIFYPYGKVGPQVWLVNGGDGRPTWDARHVLGSIEATLEQQYARALSQPSL